MIRQTLARSERGVFYLSKLSKLSLQSLSLHPCVLSTSVSLARILTLIVRHLRCLPPCASAAQAAICKLRKRKLTVVRCERRSRSGASAAVGDVRLGGSPISGDCPAVRTQGTTSVNWNTLTLSPTLTPSPVYHILSDVFMLLLCIQ